MGKVTYNRNRFIENAVLIRLSVEERSQNQANLLVVPRPGFEPGTCGSTVRRRSQARLPRDPFLTQRSMFINFSHHNIWGTALSRLLKEQLIRYSILAYKRGLTAAFGGNMSVRKGSIVFIKGTGAVMGELTGGQVAVIDIKGNQISEVRPSSEYRLHLRIYENRRDVKAVAHLHPPYSIATSALLEGELPILTPEASLYLGKIPVAPFRPAGSWELADVTAKALMDCDAAIMKNHGVVTVGRTLREAFHKAELVEESAKLWILSQESGKRSRD